MEMGHINQKMVAKTVEKIKRNGTLCRQHNNDPSAGSPTETLLRLHLPLDDKVWWLSLKTTIRDCISQIQTSHRIIQSVGATGGVYKGQGRNQCKMMICTYQEFLVQNRWLQRFIPITKHIEGFAWLSNQATCWMHQCSARAAQNI